MVPICGFCQYCKRYSEILHIFDLIIVVWFLQMGKKIFKVLYINQAVCLCTLC